MPKDGRKFSREEADKVLDIIKPIIEKHNYNYEVCGSYRRGKSEIGDLDILIENKNDNTSIHNDLNKFDLDWTGDSKIGFQLNEMHVDIKFVNKENWGAGLIHHTGPFGFNIKIRSIAKKKGLLLNEYGIFNRETKELIFQGSEFNILSYLMKEESAMKFMTPSERKNPSWVKNN